MIWKGHRFNVGTEKFINSYEGILCLQYALKYWCKIMLNTRKCARITEINRTVCGNSYVVMRVIGGIIVL